MRRPGTVDQRGGTGTGQGSVTVEGTDAVLREGNSFDVTLGRTFVVPTNPSAMRDFIGQQVGGIAKLTVPPTDDAIPVPADDLCEP